MRSYETASDTVLVERHPARAHGASLLCKGEHVRNIVVSSGGAGYGFLVDDEGQLRQAGFGPDIGAHMEGLPDGIAANLYPLAYPAYDEDRPGAAAAGHPRRRHHDDPAAGGGRR